MGRFGFGEIMLILLVLVLVFGAAKLPQLSRAVGESIRAFKKSVKEDDKEKRG